MTKSGVSLLAAAEKTLLAGLIKLRDWAKSGDVKVDLRCRNLSDRLSRCGH